MWDSLVPKHPTRCHLVLSFITENVNGVIVDIEWYSRVFVLTQGTQVWLKVIIEADLIDLQNKVGAIIDTFPLPKNNCASFSPHNPVVFVPSKEIDVTGNDPVLRVGGNVVLWECLQNPVANSKVEWETKRIGPLKRS
jgi:hypothetical protein